MAEQIQNSSNNFKNKINTQVGGNQKNDSLALLSQIVSVFLKVLVLLTFCFVLILVYVLGLVHGYEFASREAEVSVSQFLSDYSARLKNSIIPTLTQTPTPTIIQTSVKKKVVWGGPELWEAVNKRRVELGVNPLNTRSELCTIASIRLNELLDLENLDGHEGFSNMKVRRPDLKWIFDKYGTVAEFLAMGGETPSATVGLWENTLGHSQLLKGGEYVWGCIYAQNTFAVAITAF